MAFAFSNHDMVDSRGSTSNVNHELDGSIVPRDRTRLEIIPDSQLIVLKGTGDDVEPTRLSGRVSLYLSESTAIKEITLHFRGKARLPVNAYDSLHSSHPIPYLLCAHTWSFLEGQKKVPHTLKAGHHIFPFQLQLGGSLPSSLFSNYFGGATISYKLRANVSRPGLSQNLATAIPISLIRSFSPESLEYQQTVSLENTWLGKLRYSMMIPHKAWAAGDTLTAHVKLVPQEKGVRILRIHTMINEDAEVPGRLRRHFPKPVVEVIHHVVDGRLVPLLTDQGASFAAGQTHSTPSSSSSASSNLPSPSTSPEIPSSPSTPAGRASPHASPGNSLLPLRDMSSSTLEQPNDDSQQRSEVESFIRITIPRAATPSHHLDPIRISHRMRWIILFTNTNGRISELRCGLPLHLLDYRLLEEARGCTAETRRLSLGDTGHLSTHSEQEYQLPSYSAHIRDRVANMYIPDSSVLRLNNPLVVNRGTNPIVPMERSSTPSGAASPAGTPPFSHLPHTPDSQVARSLDWVNSELLLSLSRSPPTVSLQQWQDEEGGYHVSSRDRVLPNTRMHSRAMSRRGSRAPSPERRPQPHSAVGSREVHFHDGSASRELHGLFSVSLKPLSSLTHSTWFPWATSNPPYPLDSTRQGQPSADQMYTTQLHASLNPDHLHHDFTVVPDYEISSQGFLGGVTPLESLLGLPSYAEVQRLSPS